MKPVIDVHEHIFSARDIPVKGYLLSRTYGGLADFVGRKLHFFSLLAWVMRRTMHRRRRDLLYNLVVGLAGLAMGMDLRRWADIMSLGDVVKINELMLRTFAGNRTSLYIPLMLDYEYWFENSIDHTLYFQIKKMYEDVVLPARGKIHPFVPYDPARDLAYQHGLPGPDGRPERSSSLELVKKAIERQGFIGVKLYPTLGYRPVGNALVDAERRGIFTRNHMDAYAVFTGQELDDKLDALYRYCRDEQVPITVHCLADGIEAYSKASYVFGKPEYWQGVLDAYPELHVNLAHFAWNETERYLGPGYKGEPPWMKVICRMLADYPNLYTDTGCNDVMSSRSRRLYAADFQAVERDYPGVLRTRFLFGIDWHVISMTKNFERFQPDYLSLLQDEVGFSNDEVEDFLGGNALRFLGLLPEGTPPADGWCKNRVRLKAFYAAHHITPPEWFTTTG